MDSKTIEEYKEKMYEDIRLLVPYISREDIEPVLDYSINKRFRNTEASVINSYNNREANMDLLKIADYIMDKDPIICASGVMFMPYGQVPNPLADTVQSFLDNRSAYKKKMFEYPKGSFEYEKYNMQQSLEKVNTNAIYGILGLSTSLIYDINIATSVTSQGRSIVATMSLFFEQFLADNVKFGSINEVMEFITHVVSEKPNRKFNDYVILDRMVTPEECFVKVAMDCGYRWIPNEEELEIIWKAINNLDVQDVQRVYYKNNLYGFMGNSKLREIIRWIMRELKEPYLNPSEPPDNVLPALDELTDLMREYVYYGYMWIDRIDRCDNMIKAVIMISDTDSTIVSLDVWYKYCLGLISDMKDISIRRNIINPIFDIKTDEFGDLTKESKEKLSPIYHYDKEYDYDFYTDELVEQKHTESPLIMYPEDNIRHSLINILAYVIDHLVNEYLEKYCENNNSFKKDGHKKCKMMAKNEFTFARILMTPAKKSYASLQELQEGNQIPEDEQLDIKGIASMAKSSMSESTREALKKILLEDVMKADEIDQFKIIKKIAVLEKQITDSLYNGSKEFYKPVTVKAQSSYKNPMSIQGIKASVVWNALRDPDLPALNLEERNAVDIAKVKINKKTIEDIRDKYPEVYDRAITLLEDPVFKGVIDSIAIPLDVAVPEWLLDLIDYRTIVNDNVGGFVYDSIGIKRFDKNSVNYTNILQL